MSTEEQLKEREETLRQLTGDEWTIDIIAANKCAIWFPDSYLRRPSNGKTEWPHAQAIAYLDNIIGSINSGLSQPQDEETNTLLENVTNDTGRVYGVLDTPQRPLRYYAGEINVAGGMYHPRQYDNPNRFHATLQEANQKLFEIAQEEGL